MTDLTLAALVDAAESMARERADGHLTLLRFTSGWKAALSTPDLDTGAGREQIWVLPSFPRLKLALQWLLANPTWVADR